MGGQPITGSYVGEQFKDYETHDTEEEFKDKNVKASAKNESQEEREKETKSYDINY